jgi:hypothetical protein
VNYALLELFRVIQGQLNVKLAMKAVIPFPGLPSVQLVLLDSLVMELIVLNVLQALSVPVMEIVTLVQLELHKDSQVLKLVVHALLEVFPIRKVPLPVSSALRELFSLSLELNSV